MCGHDSEVTSVAVSLCLDMVITGSRDGTVNIHSVKVNCYFQEYFTFDILTCFFRKDYCEAYIVEYLQGVLK